MPLPLNGSSAIQAALSSQQAAESLMELKNCWSQSHRSSHPFFRGCPVVIAFFFPLPPNLLLAWKHSRWREKSQQIVQQCVVLNIQFLHIQVSWAKLTHCSTEHKGWKENQYFLFQFLLFNSQFCQTSTQTRGFRLVFLLLFLLLATLVEKAKCEREEKQITWQNASPEVLLYVS